MVKLPFKIFVFILTSTFLGLSCYGASQLSAEFDFNVFLNEGTYLREYFDMSAEKFPDGGSYGEIYVAEKPNVHQYITEIQTMLDEYVHVLVEYVITILCRETSSHR